MKWECRDLPLKPWGMQYVKFTNVFCLFALSIRLGQCQKEYWPELKQKQKQEI